MKKALLILAILLTFSAQVHAEVIWDWSPLTVGATKTYTSGSPLLYSDGASATNTGEPNGGGYFLECVEFSKDFFLTGMDSYENPNYILNVDGRTVISIFSHNTETGTPLSNIYESVQDFFTDSDGAIDGVVRVGSTLANPFLFQKNTKYWIGMAGRDYFGFGVSTLYGLPSGDNTFYTIGVNYNPHWPRFEYGDISFRLHGVEATSAPTVPEPGSIILLSAGLLGVAFRVRRTY